MFSQRGVLNLAPHAAGHARHRAPRQREPAERHRRRSARRRSRSRRSCPIINTSPDARYPILGASLQRRGGIARHDAVAWGYARAADARGVDIIQNCEVTGIRRDGGRVTGVETTQGLHRRRTKVGVVAAGHIPACWRRWPACACRSRAIRCRRWCPSRSSRCSTRVVMSNAVHVYVSQSDKGELVIGAGIDAYNSLRASAAASTIIEHQMAALVELFPIFSRAAHDAAVGRHRRRLPRRVPDHRRRRRSRASTSIAAGAPAASRRRRARAGSSRTPSRTTGRIRSTRPSPSIASSTGDLIDEHGAAAVAH